MNKCLAVIIFLCVGLNAVAEDRWLDYRVNKSTHIRIANVKCPIKELAKKYSYGALAYNSDRKDYLFGCFTHDGDMIVIQWAGNGSDKTIIPANAFLIGDE